MNEQLMSGTYHGPCARCDTSHWGSEPCPSNDEIMQEDVAELLRALGLSDHARIKSPHRVVREEILPAIHTYRRQRRLLAMLSADKPQFDSPMGAWEAKGLRDQIIREPSHD